MFTKTIKILLAASAIGALGCGAPKRTSPRPRARVLGDALAGTNATTFAAAKTNFAAAESNSDGLGPIFNEHSCGACHANGAVGGAGQNIERRYGTLTNGVFDPLAATGGSLRQLFGIGGFNVGGLNCNSGTDANPAPGATIFAGRLTTPLFGLGLVDSLPDARFDTLASREPAAIRGIVNRVSIALANPADSSQHVGGTRVGRFGWKAGVPNLGQFSADAYLNEMGITTSSCNGGVANRAFGTENRANRAATNAVINGCPDDAVPGTDDDFATETNNCAGGVNELQDDVANFTFFMTHLAPPRAGRDRRRHGAGPRPHAVQLDRAAVLGLPPLRTPTSSCRRRRAALPAGVVFTPYSDFLVHDMGTLGDGIGNAGDSVAVTRRMRTAPLWGLRSRNLLLHDGRTTDRGAAIAAHNGGANGQGTAAATAYGALTTAQKSDLLAFLATL